MKKRISLAALALAAACLSPASARAQANCTGFDSTFLPPDGRIFTFTAAPSTTYRFLGGTNLSGGGIARSYSIEATGFAGGFGSAPELFVRGDSFESCTLAHLTVVPRDTTRIEPRVGCDDCGFANRRFSFTTSERITFFHLQNPFGASLPVTISLAETTMFSPAWTTNGTNNTFYSFYNNTSQTITADVVLRTTAGAQASFTTLVIPAFSNVSTNTVALGTPRNVSGNARLTHDGPPGALVVEADIANFTSTPAYIQPVKFQAQREVR